MKKYPHRLGAIAIIVNNQKQFLVINDVGFTNPDDYDFVGGGRESGETPEDNVFREIREEIGLSREHFRLIGHSNHKLSFDFYSGYREFDTPEGIVRYGGQTKDAFVLEFLGDDADIKIATEHIRAYKWVDFSELKTHLNFRGQYEDAIKIIEDVIPVYLE